MTQRNPEDIHPVSDDIPSEQDYRTPRMRSVHPVDGPSRWACPYHDFETNDESLADWHKRQTHPAWCSHGVAPSCDRMAAYTYFDGRWPRPLCAEHADDYWGDGDGIVAERIERESRPANVGAERLSASHPVECKIAGGSP